LECVGLAVDDHTGLQRLVMDALTSAQRLGERDGITVLRWQDLTGARLVMGVRDGKLLDLLPSFAGTDGVRLANVRAANDNVAIADVVDEQGEQLTMLAVELEQRRFLSPARPAAGRVSVVALGVDVTVHTDADAFSNSDASFLGNADDDTDDPPANVAEQGLVRHPRMAAESLISYGVFGDPAQAEAYARINGTVLHAERRTVATTGHEFIVARIRTLGFELDMCLPGTVAPVPEPGNVIGGTAFVVASLPSIAPYDIS
jgi:hypothetical protein